MNGGYYVHYRDMECRMNDYDEMVANRRAFRAATKCEVCGAKKTHTHRHADGQIVVTCAGCVRKKPTAEQREINRSHAEARARLAAMEKRSNEL
jgi:hypothetical protein